MTGDVSTPVRSGGRLDHLKEKLALAEGGERWAATTGLMRGEGMVPRLCPLMVLYRRRGAFSHALWGGGGRGGHVCTL